MDWLEEINTELLELERAGLRRSLTVIEGPVGPKVFIDGREVILFCSNDYLGLAAHPEIKRAFVEGIERYGSGAGASRLVSGTLAPHAALEEELKKFTGREAVLLFNSGYNANMGLVTALAGRDTEIFSDRLNHASIVDAAILSRARVRRYHHCDTDSLEGMLKRSTARRKIVITEGIFSMDGDMAPLGDIAALGERYGAVVIVDDAHGIGVFGPSGRGTLEHLGIGKDSDVILMATLGKAFGLFGAFVAGPAPVIELLKSRAKTFIYTTALPPGLLFAATRALEIVTAAEERRKKIFGNAELMRGLLQEAGLDTLGSASQIIPAVAGAAERVMEISRRLLERGVYVQGIRPPTVPRGTARLRVTVTAAHSEEDVREAAGAIVETFRQCAVTV